MTGIHLLFLHFLLEKNGFDSWRPSSPVIWYFPTARSPSVESVAFGCQSWAATWALGLHITAQGSSQTEPGGMVFSLHCICRQGWIIRILSFSEALQAFNCSVKGKGRNLDGQGESNFVCHSKLSSWNVKFGFENLIWNTDFESTFWPTAWA